MSRGEGAPSGAQQVLAEIPGQVPSGEQSTIALAQALVVEQSASIGPLSGHFSSSSEMLGRGGLPFMGEASGIILAINAAPFSH